MGGWLVWGWWGRRGDTICQHLRNLHHYYPHPRTIHHHFVMEGNNVFQGCFWPDLGGHLGSFVDLTNMQTICNIIFCTPFGPETTKFCCIHFFLLLLSDFFAVCAHVGCVLWG